MLTHMSFGQIDPDTDGISQHVIDKLSTEMNKMNVNMIRPNQNDNKQCSNLKQARYLVGVEARMGQSGLLEIRIDAYDQTQENWTVSFQRIWRSALNAEGKQLLAERKTDEQLRGTKFLPYAETQQQEIINHFQLAIDCFKQNKQTDAINISREGKFLPSRLKDITKQISQQSHNEGSPLILSTKTINQQSQLYMLTLSDPADQQNALLQSYFRLSKAKQIAPKVNPLTFNPLKPSPDEQPVSNISVDLTSPILGSTQLVRPHGSALCASPTPWSLGEQTITEEQEIASDQCFGISAQVQRAAYLIVIGRNAKGQFSRFHPTVCDYLDDAPARLDRDATFHYPTRQAPVQVLGLDENTGEEKIYLIATANKQLQLNVLNEIQDVPEICDDQDSEARDSQQWETKLNRLKADNPGLFQWRVHTFMHVE
jgi:hypothetical protein